MATSLIQENSPDFDIVDALRIRLTRKIASGGMGSVYEAKIYGAMGFEKTIAVKTILENLCENSDFVGHFIGEAKLVADLVHQNICQVYHLGQVANRYYIAMEYISGIHLKEFLDAHVRNETAIPIDIVTFIVSRICRGLEYAHNKRDREGRLLGVVHRDISPKNIMISTEGEVKLTDFGVAKARNLKKSEEGEVLMGNVAYMSPEQAQYFPTDSRSDLFSLGIIMYELLTRQLLFSDKAPSQSLINVVRKAIPPLRTLNPDVDENLERIVMKALSRDVEERYQSASQMGYDLEYAMYHKGYGPTIITVEKYLRTLFPDLFSDVPILMTDDEEVTNPNAETIVIEGD